MSMNPFATNAKLVTVLNLVLAPFLTCTWKVAPYVMEMYGHRREPQLVLAKRRCRFAASSARFEVSISNTSYPAWLGWSWSGRRQSAGTRKMGKCPLSSGENGEGRWLMVPHGSAYLSSTLNKVDKAPHFYSKREAPHNGKGDKKRPLPKIESPAPRASRIS